MFPIRDHNPSGRVPYVTYGLIAINILVFLTYVGSIGQTAEYAAFLDTWAMIPAEVTTGEDTHTLLTSMFLHGGIMHLAGNMLFLWIFGDNVEDAFGHIGFLIFYILSGLAADAAHVLSDADSMVPVVGASGAIAGVMGAYLLLYPRAEVDILLILIIIFRLITLPAFVVLALWFGLQVVSGTLTSSEMGGVAYWAHAGGFVAGLLFTVPLWMAKGGTAFWQKHQGHPPHPEAKVPERISNIPVVRRR